MWHRVALARKTGRAPSVAPSRRVFVMGEAMSACGLCWGSGGFPLVFLAVVGPCYFWLFLVVVPPPFSASRGKTTLDGVRFHRLQFSSLLPHPINPPFESFVVIVFVVVRLDTYRCLYASSLLRKSFWASLVRTKYRVRNHPSRSLQPFREVLYATIHARLEFHQLPRGHRQADLDVPTFLLCVQSIGTPGLLRP